MRNVNYNYKNANYKKNSSSANLNNLLIQIKNMWASRKSIIFKIDQDFKVHKNLRHQIHHNWEKEIILVRQLVYRMM